MLRRAYSADEFDFVAAYCAELDSCHAVPISLFGVSGCLRLRLSRARNGQRAGLHLAENYRLGAIAQLEERRHGMAEVVGSSPTSSTPTGAREAPVVVGAHEFRASAGGRVTRRAVA
jgi:hypothetical protein